MPQTALELGGDVIAYHNAPLPRWLEKRAIIEGEEHYLDADAALEYCAWAMARGLTLLGFDWALWDVATQRISHEFATEDATTWPALIAALREAIVQGSTSAHQAPILVVNIWVTTEDRDTP